MSWSSSDFYLFCFLIGFSLSVLSFFAGAVHLHLPFKMHFPFHVSHAHVGHAGGHGAQQNSGSHVSWFNASTVLAFLAWFGGVGYLMTKYSHVETLLVVAISMGAGMAAGWLVLRFLIALVGDDDQPLRESDGRVIGAVGTVSMTIRENGTGEIIFPIAGSRRCSGARSENGVAIEKGAEIVIARYEKGIAYVRRWEEFVNS